MFAIKGTRKIKFIYRCNISAVTLIVNKQKKPQRFLINYAQQSCWKLEIEIMSK